MSPLLKLYLHPGEDETAVLRKIQSVLPDLELAAVQTEYCFNVDVLGEEALPNDQKEALIWLIAESLERARVSESSCLTASEAEFILEVGPRLAFTTAWSSNCSSICEVSGVTAVGRIERSRRYLIRTANPLTAAEQAAVAAALYDRMTESIYDNLTSYDNGPCTPKEVQTIPLQLNGMRELRALNDSAGLGMDEDDLANIMNLYTMLDRDPTDVEIYDLAQSNSEHSRHGFFNAQLVLDGIAAPKTLFQLVKGTQPKHRSNSVIAFHDNASAIRGVEVTCLRPLSPRGPSPFGSQTILLHPTLTAETHNFPTAVAPFAGAETGTGGRLRDVVAAGRGAIHLAGLTGFCVGNLLIPQHPLPWETDAPYPSAFVRPLDILLQASSGAYDYGNKYGEPTVGGFTRSYGQCASGKRTEWIKPIMFSAGIGLLDDRHVTKAVPEAGMLICKAGGPAYRIGMGGGSASSRPVQGAGSEGGDAADLDFQAVQRGDAEMENRLHRFIRCCVELGEDNPILSIHDQGAGGNGNVLKEIVHTRGLGLGAQIDAGAIPRGDPSLSMLELWVAEYQENHAILLHSAQLDLVQAIGAREHCAVTPVGKVTTTGRMVVSSKAEGICYDLPLAWASGDQGPTATQSRKVYTCQTPTPPRSADPQPDISSESTIPCVAAALDRVLCLLDVGSKRFLTSKVDRCVGGLVAQQPCVGPLQLPLADVAVLANSHQSLTGIATAIGEQPIKGITNNEAQARMTVIEALSNLVFAQISCLEDVKASCNWMWAAKAEGEAARMYACCSALCDVLQALGPAIDGGKDSLSMAAQVNRPNGKVEVVLAPGQMVLTCYAPCPDITRTVTPDLKRPAGGSLLGYLDLSEGHARIGGSALSTVYGEQSLFRDQAMPDLTSEGVQMFKRAFQGIQLCISRGLLKAGHDRSDGGLIVTLLEMAFAGNCGMDVSVPSGETLSPLEVLFAEEAGFVLEIAASDWDEVNAILTPSGGTLTAIGAPSAEKRIIIRCGDEVVLDDSMTRLRDVWESTSFALEELQSARECVQAERQSLAHSNGPTYQLTFDPRPSPCGPISSKSKIAVLRAEGSNGDREMIAAFAATGLEVWDVCMTDLLSNAISLDRFRGVAFVGGFSFADVLGSAKGWAAAVLRHPHLLMQFDRFRDRSDTFSLGVCNGCQLMAQLRWVGACAAGDSRFLKNSSGRFESRWVTVTVQPSPSVLLAGMAGSTIGVWVAHGEGRFTAAEEVLQKMDCSALAPLRYADEEAQPTQAYPQNPNGSPLGIAGLCSEDGRHLALMPHPERCFLPWQLPYPHLFGGEQVAPWMKIFQNARVFCERE